MTILNEIDQVMDDALDTMQEIEDNQNRILAACTPAQLSTVQKARSKKWVINTMQDNTVQMFNQATTDYLYVQPNGKFYRKK